jgi:hypothetical protein
MINDPIVTPVYLVDGPSLAATPVYIARKGYLGAKPVRFVDQKSHPEAAPVRLVSRDEVIGARPVYEVDGIGA